MAGDLDDLLGPLEGPPEVVRRRFEARYAVAADTFGALAGPDELDDAWDAYASGRLAELLAEPTPETAARARALVAAVARLVADPQPDDPRWRNRLAARVDQLATLLLPVDAAGLDPDDEPPWRTTWVEDVRLEFAAALAGAAPEDAEEDEG